MRALAHERLWVKNGWRGRRKAESTFIDYTRAVPSHGSLSLFRSRIPRSCRSPLPEDISNLYFGSISLGSRGQGIPQAEPGIRRGNEDSRRNKNWKSRENIFSVEKKIKMHTFFRWKLRWWICEGKLKVQHWYSSWFFVCYISSNLPPECLKLHRF